MWRLKTLCLTCGDSGSCYAGSTWASISSKSDRLRWRGSLQKLNCRKCGAYVEHRVTVFPEGALSVGEDDIQ